MKYDVLIFDADETLFDFKKSEEVAFKRMLNDFNIGNEESNYQVYQKINTAIWKEFEKGQITQEALKVERFKRFASMNNINANETLMADFYMEHLAKASFLYPDSLEVIERLAKNFRLIIITNGLKKVQEGRIKGSTIAKFFDEIVISEEIKVAKPNPGIFHYALEKIDYSNKNKVLMIGDSLTSDILGGNNFGIDTCWFNPHKVINKTDIRPTFEIDNLKDLYTLLNQ